jgi:sulfoxide reductase catalytic subunit YedY
MLIKPSDITPREVYEGRRRFIAGIAATAAVGTSVWEMANRQAFAQGAAPKLPAARNAAF